MADFFTYLSPYSFYLALMILLFPVSVIAYAISFTHFMKSIAHSEQARGERRV